MGPIFWKFSIALTFALSKFEYVPRISLWLTSWSVYPSALKYTTTKTAVGLPLWPFMGDESLFFASSKRGSSFSGNGWVRSRP